MGSYTETFERERETKGTLVFSRDNNGRKETQYVPKSRLGDARPDEIRLTVEWDG